MRQEELIRKKKNQPVYEADENEEESSERISVWDAADIWMSNGQDEDYMFGYTEKELWDAL